MEFHKELSLNNPVISMVIQNPTSIVASFVHEIGTVALPTLWSIPSMPLPFSLEVSDRIPSCGGRLSISGFARLSTSLPLGYHQANYDSWNGLGKDSFFYKLNTYSWNLYTTFPWCSVVMMGCCKLLVVM